MIRWFTFPDLIKQLVFGVHLPVMGFDKNSNENQGKENPHSREQILSIARKAESLGYDSLSVNDHIVFRTSWLDSLSALAAVASVTNKEALSYVLNPYQPLIFYPLEGYLQQELGLVHIKEIMMFVEFPLKRDGVGLTKH